MSQKGIIIYQLKTEDYKNNKINNYYPFITQRKIHHFDLFIKIN